MEKRVDILGVHISIINPSKAFVTIVGWIKNHQKQYVCVAPVSTLVDCHKDIDYKQVVNNAGMVTPDGMPVVWVAKHLKGVQGIERTYGPDLMRSLCDQGQGLGLKHYFFGSTQETLDKLSSQLKKVYPAINIVGTFSPPFRSKTCVEDKHIIDMLNKVQPDIIWVGLGAPKQDFWMALNRPLLEAPVLIGIGAAFDFLAGTKPQAPRWMGALGLEWLFRLCCEPKRLWKRYLIGNTVFVIELIKDCFKTRK